MSAASDHYTRLATEAQASPDDKDRRRWVLEEIQRDTARDVERFEGAPFTGKTVAEYMGCQAVAITALARVVATLLPARNFEFLLWSHKHSMWWRADARGYTSDLGEAGRYTEVEATKRVVQSAFHGHYSQTTSMVVAP